MPDQSRVFLSCCDCVWVCSCVWLCIYVYICVCACTCVCIRVGVCVCVSCVNVLKGRDQDTARQMFNDTTPEHCPRLHLRPTPHMGLQVNPVSNRLSKFTCLIFINKNSPVLGDFPFPFLSPAFFLCLCWNSTFWVNIQLTFVAIKVHCHTRPLWPATAPLLPAPAPLHAHAHTPTPGRLN